MSENNKQNTINIIIPAFNEEENINETILSLQALISKTERKFKIIIVNDNSKDKTKSIAETLAKKFSNIVCINRKGRHGLGRCINRGIEEIENGYIVILMADLADDVNDILKMAEELDKGADVVCGSRYIKGGSGVHHLKIKGFLSELLGLTLKILTGIPTRDATNAYKMYKSEILDKIGVLHSDNYASGLEVVIKSYCSGLKIVEIPTIWKDRSFGTSSFKIIKVAPEYIYWTLWAMKKIYGYKLRSLFSVKPTSLKSKFS